MTDLETVKTEPSPSVVEWLEELLEAAKAGYIRGISVQWTGPGGHTSHGWDHEGGSAARILLAEMVIAQTDMANSTGIRERDSFLAQELEPYL